MGERVYMVWDIYDGVRSGIANYDGKPHYFKCIFDKQIDDYSNNFELKRIDSETLELAQEQWSIYRTWEAKFHSGSEPLEKHPSHGGVDDRYDQLEDLLQTRIQAISVTKIAVASFRAKEKQPSLPDGCLYEMEVDWN